MLTQPQPPHDDEIPELCNSFSLQDQWNSVQSNQYSTVSIAGGRICVVCIYLNFHWRNMRCDVKIQRLWSLVDKRNDVTLFESLSEIDFQRWIIIYKEKNTSFATFQCHYRPKYQKLSSDNHLHLILWTSRQEKEKFVQFHLFTRRG